MSAPGVPSPGPSTAGNAVLLLSCPDQPGLVAEVSGFVFQHGGNIVHAEQHTDHEVGAFFQRVEFELDGFSIPRDELAARFAPLAARFGMTTHLRFTAEVPRVALLLSRQPHCAYDLLARWRMGELPCEIAVAVSNHPDHADLAAHFGVPFHHHPVTPETKTTQEAAVLGLLAAARVDVVVLARYMQILSPEFCRRYAERVINIHHSFLPAFAGGHPYAQAHARGVKIVGATAHYATAELDEGPIIDQDVIRVTHRDSVDDLIRKGRDLEKVVLARALRLHLEHRILVYGNKTVVFT